MKTPVTLQNEDAAIRFYLRALDAPDDASSLRLLAQATARALGARSAVLEVEERGEQFAARWPTRRYAAPGAATLRMEIPGGRLTATMGDRDPVDKSAVRATRATLTLALAGWRRARRRAGWDSLTGLPNQLGLREALQRMWREAERYDAPLALAAADVDGFKAWNERYGHLAGDRALKRIARMLRRECRSSDLVARWGGDEFVILLPRTDRAGAEALARRLRERCPPPGISIGVACREEIGRGGAWALWRQADAALRRTKRRRPVSSLRAVRRTVTSRS